MRMRILVIAGLLILAAGLGVFLFSRTRESALSENKEDIAAAVSEQNILADIPALEQKADIIRLKAVYQKLISDFPNSKDAGAWQKKLDEINLKLIFSSAVVPGLSQEYVVQPQDTLTKIAKQFNATVELIKKSNGLASDNIRPGKKLKVWTARFTVFVDKSQNILTLKCNDEIIKTYNVATGTNNSTPVGTFKIGNKLVNPVWYKEGAVVPAGSPENILGTRWLGFDDLPSYGIHGTTEPQSIGKQSTAGCVRMINAEVEELYSLLPIGTEVTVVD